jgi:hypothetical protein
MATTSPSRSQQPINTGIELYEPTAPHLQGCHHQPPARIAYHQCGQTIRNYPCTPKGERSNKHAQQQLFLVLQTQQPTFIAAKSGQGCVDLTGLLPYFLPVTSPGIQSIPFLASYSLIS